MRFSAEFALRRAMERAIPGGIACVDLEGRQSYVNIRFSEMVGWTADELTGAGPPFLYWPPEDVPALRSAFDAALRGETPPQGFELRFQRRGGGRFDVCLGAAPIGEGGENRGWLFSVCDITENKRAEQRRNVEQEVTRVLADSDSLAVAAPRIIRAICATLQCNMGALWIVDRGAGLARCLDTACLDSAVVDRFEALTRGSVFERGVGLPGRVWSSGAPAWIPNLAVDSNFPRAAVANQEGLHAAFAFPILLGGEVLGVMEFFSPEIRAPDEGLLRTAAAIGQQVGQFVERTQAEDALRSSEERFRNIVETANEGVWLVDGGGRVLYVNRRLADMLGYDSGEIEGRAATQFVFPDEAETARARISANIQGHHEQFDLRFRRKDGQEVLALACTSPVRDSDGDVVSALGMFTDVTERRRAEAEARLLAAIVESSEDAILSKTLDGIIRSWNPSAERIFGYAASEVVGRPVTMLLPPDLMNEEAVILDRLQQGERIEHFETMRLRKDGRRIHVAMTVSPVRDRMGRIIGGSNITRDITERMRFEEKLRETQKLESLGVLAGGVAHDFNNLLVGIMGNASLALDSLAAPNPARPMIEGVLHASERAAELTRQLLAYAGKGPFIIQLVDLSELVRHMVALLQSSIPRTVRLELDLAPGLPPVEADVAQIQQLIMNLVINGAEAIGPGTGTVTVRTSARWRSARDAERSQFVLLEVTDDGCGMDEQVKARIFDPFFTTKFTGRGLGLAAALGAVRGHRGTIHVDTALGRGSTFTVLLPASEGLAAEREKGEERDLGGAGLILVVDDEDIVLRTAGLTLERYGYRVIAARNGKEAIEILRTTETVRLVLLDLTMPVMSGEETLPYLKRIRPEVPVLLSSGFTEMEAIRRFEGRGLAGFLQKPYTAEQLAEKVKAAAGAANA